jgi:hypothetical protein
MMETTLDDIMTEVAEEERQDFIDELSQDESFDEKDAWESGDVCRECGRPLAERDEYTCPCGVTYSRR